MGRTSLITLLVAGIAIAGCGGNKQTAEQEAAPATPAPADTGATAATSKYDEGPRAGESAVDAALAASGEKLFQSKGCFVCHGFGKKVTCPDLVGVSMRRTALWMENQILHPEVMVKEDPISKELRTHYSLPMTNQNVAPNEAKALIEFLKRKDSQAGVQGVRS
jgi:cytochrome c